MARERRSRLIDAFTAHLLLSRFFSHWNTSRPMFNWLHAAVVNDHSEILSLLLLYYQGLLAYIICNPVGDPTTRVDISKV
ncbi:hypothetical protein KIN20_005035 [Parelaphostrongylus tenuis]|uniref:Uncharacterized protein n=1 Tax=Parelaphostrongylus tenuis TaxID=148309 RepID=A0AAD5MHS9_PARTN|nr:hypothetical protein KIN20_005035 [Parelaphostrongylus tenuis]